MQTKPLNQANLKNHVGYNCRRAYNFITGHYEALAKECALKPPEFSVLELLTHNSNVTAKKLALAVDIAPPNMVILLDKLEVRGLLQRRPNPRDGRSQIVEITPSGSALAAKAASLIKEGDAQALGALTEKEVVQLNKLLQKVYHPA